MTHDKPVLVHTERIFITSEMARRFLRPNIANNRQLNRDRINQYARDMRAGKWKENGDTIKFADTGELIDGQHRLTASVESGCGFWGLVAYGISKDAFMTIDRNQVRSTGQLLHLTTGAVNYNHLTAALAWLFRFRDGIVLNARIVRPTPMETSQLYDENPGIADSIKAAVGIHRQFNTSSLSALAFCHYCFTRQDATLADMFFEGLATGANLKMSDPVYRLRERIISSKSHMSSKLNPYEFIAVMFKAWLAERQGKTFGNSLRWAVGESFPNIGMLPGVRKLRPEMIEEPKEIKKKLGVTGKAHGSKGKNQHTRNKAKAGEEVLRRISVEN